MVRLAETTMTSKKPPLTDKRLLFIDMARLYGVGLVYYGHFIESYMKAGSSVAAMHYKFIYSFHMPLFFVLSGYIAKKHVSNTSFQAWLKKHMASRLVPYLFLSLLLIIPTFWITGFTVGLSLPSVEGYVKGIAATVLAGFPYFNIPTWFLICLFVVEIFHYVTSRFLSSNARILLIALGFYVFGSILAWNAGFMRPTNILSPHGKIYPYFMILEAFTGYAVYLIGVYLRRNNVLGGSSPPLILAASAFTCLMLVFLTYDLNKGMFLIPFYDAVILLASSHGNPILFPLTALAGSLMILIIAKMTPRLRFLCYLGGNTVIIFGLNGVFYHLVNDRLASYLLLLHGNDSLNILLSGLAVTLVSMCLTVPFVFTFNRFCPQLMGKPQVDGPLLKRLIQ